MSRWRKAARAAIQQALSGLPQNASHQEIKSAIDNAYPFGFRELYPYKVWLEERRAYLRFLGVPTRMVKSDDHNLRKRGYISPGQLSLFD